MIRTTSARGRHEAGRGLGQRAGGRRGPPRVARLMTVVCGCVLVFAVGLPITGSSQVTGVEESFRIDNDSARPHKTFEAFDTGAMAAFDLDGDGVKEIIVHNDNNNAYVFNGETGDLVAELETDHPSGWGSRELAGVSVGDVTGNGRPDLVITNSAGRVTAFETRAEQGLVFEKLWEKKVDPEEEDPDYLENNPWVSPKDNPGLDGAAYLADATGDGRDEIFFQLDDIPSLYALNGDGGTRWWYDWSDGNANPIATDLSGNGRIEVAYPSDGGRLFVFDGDTGGFRCSFNARDHGPKPASISVAPTAVDLTGDGRKELVFGVRNAVEDKDDPDWHEKQHAHYFAVDADCEVLWHESWDWGNPHVHMHPVPVDVTGNGELDVVFQDWNTVGHKPGDWEVTGKPNLFAVKGSTGELIWQVETQGFWSNSNIALADVTDDDRQELLVVGSQAGQEGVSLFDLQGERIGFIEAPGGWRVNRGPSAVDLDGDGTVEIVLPIMRDASGCSRDLDVGCREGALQVYRTQGSGEPIWPNVKFFNDAYDDQGVEPGSEVAFEEERSDPGSPQTGEESPPQTRDDGSQDSQTEEGSPTPTQDNGSQASQTEEESPTPAQEGDQGPSAASGGGGGGGGSAPPPEPPVIIFDEGFPAQGEPHDPMDPLVVHVSAEPRVESVEMDLGGLLLDVEFDGQTAVHTPTEPLPTGNHSFIVNATSEDGVPASEGRTLFIRADQGEEPEQKAEADDAPGDGLAFPEDPGGDDEEAGQDDEQDEGAQRQSPLGLLVTLLALGALVFVIRGRRAA